VRLAEQFVLGESGDRMLDLRPGRHNELGVETLHAHVQRHAESSPESAAILAAGRALLTYARLESQIRHVGDKLRLAGIRASDRVAVVLPGGAEAAVAILAVGANAACAPLNPALSAREFERCLSALRATALLVPHGSFSSVVALARSLHLRVLHLLPDPASPAGLFSLASDWDVSASLEQSATEGDPALLLFTSGTTARPKLVPLTHRQLALSAENICSALQLGPSDRCLGVMPLHHIHGLSTLFASLVSGGSYVGVAQFSPERFVAGLEEFEPTWYSASPAIHRAILNNADLSRTEFRAGGLRFIRSASAPMPLPLIGEIESAFGVPLIEAYGMTEAAPQIASNRLPPFDRKPGSVGNAAGPDLAIMDAAGRLLRPGETGEVVMAFLPFEPLVRLASPFRSPYA
jgi:acyl-CoA synthetase (AMP-forming)/AMP-acid ligase II